MKKKKAKEKTWLDLLNVSILRGETNTKKKRNKNQIQTYKK